MTTNDIVGVGVEKWCVRVRDSDVVIATFLYHMGLPPRVNFHALQHLAEAGEKNNLNTTGSAFGTSWSGSRVSNTHRKKKTVGAISNIAMPIPNVP